MLTGPGAIIGLNNGDPTCHEPEKGNAHSIYNGLEQVIVQSGYEGKGELTLRATAEGLTAAEAVIEVKAAAARPFVPVTAAPPQRAGGRRGAPGG